MLRAIKKRLRQLEKRIWTKLPFWPDDGDGFVSALGVDPERFKIIKADGLAGYDFVAALSATAEADWREENE